MTEERRLSPRSKRGFRVLDGASDAQIQHIDNISCSGVLCHTNAPIPEMTKLAIVLELPAPINHQVNAEGIVIRCVAEEPDHEAFKVAILYTHVDDDHLDAIRTYVEHDLENQ